jgi:hypothetical protein
MYYVMGRFGEAFDIFNKRARRKAHNFVRKGRYHHAIKLINRRRLRRAGKLDPANAPKKLGYRGWEF